MGHTRMWSLYLWSYIYFMTGQATDANSPCIRSKKRLLGFALRILKWGKVLMISKGNNLQMLRSSWDYPPMNDRVAPAVTPRPPGFRKGSYFSLLRHTPFLSLKLPFIGLWGKPLKVLSPIKTNSEAPCRMWQHPIVLKTTKTRSGETWVLAPALSG